MEADQFLKCFKDVFVKDTTAIEVSEILIFDEHNSCLTVPLIEKALRNDIKIICLSVHASHVLQPFKSLKGHCKNILKDHWFQNCR